MLSAAPEFSSEHPAIRFRIGPVSLRTTNQYTGLYALDTFDVTRAFSITAGGRFNVANINLQDQLGTALNGNDTYTRFNPIIGGTYKITPGLTAYAGYSEANRAPTPLELGCADPAHPCIIASFLVSDPPLKQVVSHTVEAGLRGTQELQFGTLGWKLGAFRADNTDDILAIPSTAVQGFGYFQNVGSTRRQGIEAEVTLKSKTMQVLRQLYLYRRALPGRAATRLQQSVCRRQRQYPDLAGQSDPGDSAQPDQGRVRLCGNRRHSRSAAMQLFIGSQYFVGDESNQYSRLPSYAVFNLHASYQIDKNFQIYARADNIFDNRYANYGTFFDTDAVPNFANGGNRSPTRVRSARRGRVLSMPA